MSEASINPGMRVTADFSGRVQGVGFRYTTVNIARRYHVAGYVRNQPDGRVEVVAEGKQADLKAFIESIVETMGSHITDYTTDNTPATGEFGDPSTPGNFKVCY